MTGTGEPPCAMKRFLTKWLAWCAILFLWRLWIVVSLNQPGAHDEDLVWARFTSIIAALVNFWVVLPAAALFVVVRRRSGSKAITLAAAALAALVALEVPGRYGAYARPRAVQRIVPQLDSARDALRAHVVRYGKPPRRAIDLPQGTPLHTIRGCTALEIGWGHLWSFCQHGFGTDDVISMRREPDWDAGSIVEIAPGWWYHRSPLIP